MMASRGKSQGMNSQQVAPRHSVDFLDFYTGGKSRPIDYSTGM